MRIKPGFGYWAASSPGGFLIFHRAGDTGRELADVKSIPPDRRKSVHHCDSEGKTADGCQVFFHSEHTDAGHAH